MPFLLSTSYVWFIVDINSYIFSTYLCVFQLITRKILPCKYFPTSFLICASLNYNKVMKTEPIRSMSRKLAATLAFHLLNMQLTIPVLADAGPNAIPGLSAQCQTLPL